MRIADTIDIFKETADAVCVTTNGIVKRDGSAVMGAGIARLADAKYKLASKLGAMLKKSGNHCSDMGLYDNKHIVTFPTKKHWKDMSSLTLIKQSCHELVAMADKNNWNNVLLPAIGCGLGQLDFETQVKPVIETILDDRFTICFLTNARQSDKAGECADKKFEHNGYVISQCGSNHHVMISKDGKMVFHSQVDHDMNREELIKVFDGYIELTKHIDFAKEFYRNEGRID